jgi:hypothetical protein
VIRAFEAHAKTLQGAGLTRARGSAPKKGPRLRPIRMREGALPNGGDALQLRAFAPSARPVLRLRVTGHAAQSSNRLQPLWADREYRGGLHHSGQFGEDRRAFVRKALCGFEF